MKTLLGTIALIACLLALPSQAGLIPPDSTNLDGETGILGGNPSSSPHPDETDEISIDAALSAYAPFGWRPSSKSETADLFNAFNFGVSSEIDDPETKEILSTRRRAQGRKNIDFNVLLGDVNGVAAPNGPLDPLLAPPPLFEGAEDVEALYDQARAEGWAWRPPAQERRSGPPRERSEAERGQVNLSYMVLLGAAWTLLMAVIKDPVAIALMVCVLLFLGVKRRRKRSSPE
ncbi:hypothetical protein [Motiliproteus sp. SC1-56]|uniref:hypothetical protein n=1 Tax=Motiliproteus sp. SC1-56 TaxID=2799565 RepID=UPI001A8CFD1A|nr:hypothetical protein [Motiliproteus sp. SC1-56]